LGDFISLSQKSYEISNLALRFIRQRSIFIYKLLLCHLVFLLAFKYDTPIVSCNAARKQQNASTHRERPKRDFSGLAEPQAGGDAVARDDTHPGLLGCVLQR